MSVFSQVGPLRHGVPIVDVQTGAPTSAFERAFNTVFGNTSTVNVAAVAAQSTADGKQPLDDDLTAIAALTTTAIGRSLLAIANAAAGRLILSAAAHDPQIQSVASAATVTPTFANDQVNITAQAAALTLANPTGTAVDGWRITIRIKDNGTARAITYGAQYRAIGVTLPTTTVISKTLYLVMIFNNAATKWDVILVAQEV